MTNQSQHTYNRSLAERMLHATLFEILAIGISAPLAAWLTGESPASMGLLSAVVATMALIWNIIYNWLFDRLQKRMLFERTVLVRIAHACGFEAGLLIAAVPFVAWWLNVTLWYALAVDIGLVLFYLPYTFFYNLGYDKIRQAIMLRRAYP
ncbi:MAG TPA: multidrug/biocide efflux PACE transporter [Candidimonas sp.]|nr:multidrug/biocide efflux PACE transporter [Candidimonas sp.]